MSIILDLEPELERVLQAQAQARGVSVQHFIYDLVTEQVRAAIPPAVVKRTLTLPARDLGNMGSLHRRDIYDDAG